MKVTDVSNGTAVKVNDQPLELKQDEIYIAVIKQRSSKDEFVLQIRGKEIKVRLDGEIPQKDRITIQVIEGNGEIPFVKLVNNTPKAQTTDIDITKILRALGTTPTIELKQLAQILIDQGSPLNREVIQNLKLFLEKSSGDLQQKMTTVQTILNKGLSLTPSHLVSVHEALHGQSIANLLTELIESIEPDTRQKIEKQKPDTPLRVSSDANNIPIESIHQLRVNLKSNPIEFVINEVKEQIIAHPRVPQIIREKLEKVVEESQQLQQKGFSDLARKWMGQALSSLTSLENSESSMIDFDDFDSDQLNEEMIQKWVSNQFDELHKDGNIQLKDLPSELYTEIKQSTKQYVVTEVTRKLSDITVEFRDLKREVVRNMDVMLRIMDQTKSQALPQIKPLLESTINKLDHAILQSDITLYTDMTTEKKLLVASSQLAEAKRLLGKGEHDLAFKKVQEIKSSLEKLNWQPADYKIKHLLTKEMTSHQPKLNQNRYVPILEETIEHFQYHKDLTSKDVFELVRKMGLNHDSEAAQAISLNPEQAKQEDLQQNMKAVILQLLKDDADGSPEHRNQAEQLLNNITGQQLLSKQDIGSAQTMLFNLPMQWGNQKEDIKLFVNAKKEGHKMDWENCSLYFLLETKKLGEIGVLLSANDRNLAITLKNDLPQFKEKSTKILEPYLERIKEIGYNLTSVQFTKLIADKETVKISEESKNKANLPVQATSQSKRGFDLTI